MEEILVKYFKGTSTPEETIQVEDFKKSFPAEFELLKQLWQNREKIEVEDYPTAPAWNRLLQQIDVPQRKSKSLFPPVWRWAATVLLIAVATVLLWQIVGTNPIIVRSGNETNTPIRLHDGTLVWLNQNARLTYNEVFSSETRNVKLVGEAYFEVIRDTDRPFIITSNQAEVQVLGTSFNFRSTDSLALVSVTSGKVQVNATGGTASNIFIQGEEAVVTNEKVVKRAISPNIQSWRTGDFKFDNLSIQEVIPRLKSYYREGLDYEIDSVNCLLTASITDMSITEVQELLESVCHLKAITQ